MSGATPSQPEPIAAAATIADVIARMEAIDDELPHKRVGDHLAERTATRVTDEQNGVAVMLFGRDDNGRAVTDVKHLCADLIQERANLLHVRFVARPTARLHLQEVEHDDRAA